MGITNHLSCIWFQLTHKQTQVNTLSLKRCRQVNFRTTLASSRMATSKGVGQVQSKEPCVDVLQWPRLRDSLHYGEVDQE